MPLYEYQCSVCNCIKEEFTNDREQKTSICEECGHVSIKIMSTFGWDIKGGGAYRTGPPAPIKEK